MGALGFDPIELIEVGYAPRTTRAEWLESVAAAVSKHIDADGFGAIAYFMTAAGPSDLTAVEAPGARLKAAEMFGFLSEGMATAPPEVHERLARAMQIPGYSTLKESVGWILPMTESVRVVDSPALVVSSGEGLDAVITTFCSDETAGTQERAVWRRVALHFGAALRMVERPRPLDADDVEVVVDARGAVAHAAGGGLDAESRSAVRDAVARLDRARTREGRADPMEALELWQALLAGRWSLVEQFDSDGRRFITARKNDPSVAEPRTLSRRQRQVVFYASLGWSFKEIGYALGLAESTVNTHLTESLARLGLRSRAELVRLASELATAAPETGDD